MLTVKTWRDPYDSCFNTTKKRKVEFKEGLTVLIGCNGAGKSTLLHNIKQHCEDNDIPVFFHDDRRNGNHSDVMQNLLNGGCIEELAYYSQSSEGERISSNISFVAGRLREFIRQKTESHQRVILLDAIDSGFSIDNVLELKELFKLIIEDTHNTTIYDGDDLYTHEIYIIVSANEYELACKEQCFDAYEGKYVSIRTYKTYKNFIMNSRMKKERRIDKANEKLKLRDEKERNGRKNKR